MIKVALASFVAIFIATSSPSPPSQTQDIHALMLLTQAFDRVKRDNKIVEDTLIIERTHRIDNLDNSGDPQSHEKTIVMEISKNKKTGEIEKKVIKTVPPETSLPNIPFEINKILDSFLSRFYFRVNPEKIVIDGKNYIQISFWAKEVGNLPPEKDKIDAVLAQSAGIILIEETTMTLYQISTSLKKNEVVDRFWFDVYIMDITAKFSNSNKLNVLESVFVRARYFYIPLVKKVWRFQNHNLDYRYNVPK